MPHVWFLMLDMEVTLVLLALYALYRRCGAHTLFRACIVLWTGSVAYTWWHMVTRMVHPLRRMDVEEGLTGANIYMQSFSFYAAPLAVAGVLAAHFHARGIAACTQRRGIAATPLLIIAGCIYPFVLCRYIHEGMQIKTAIDRGDQSLLYSTLWPGRLFLGSVPTVHAVSLYLFVTSPREAVLDAMRRVLGHFVFRSLATITFAVYLSHGPISILVVSHTSHPYTIDFLDDKLLINFITIGFLAVSFTCGAALHHLIEVPWARVVRTLRN